MNPVLGAILVLAALGATYAFARANIQGGAIVSVVLGAGIALLQTTSHVAAVTQLRSLRPPPMPPAASTTPTVRPPGGAS